MGIYLATKNLSKKFRRLKRIPNIFSFKIKKRNISFNIHPEIIQSTLIDKIKAEAQKSGDRIKEIQENNPFLGHFAFRHVSLFVLITVVLISNLITAKESDVIYQEISSEITLSESAAVSKEDIGSLITKVSKYTPMIDENPARLVNRLALKDQIVMADGQYMAKPSVLVTFANTTDTVDNSSSEAEKKREITTYYVLGGDTISSIAKKFGISTITIKAANNLGSDTIKPGQKLTILPADGIVHTVSRGETLSAIVAKYQGNLHKTIEDNNLGRADQIFAGQKIVIIDGKQPATTRLASRTNTQGKVSGIKVNQSKGPNHFPFGWCTWYVASRRYVPWRGNANTWVTQARRSGYQTGRTPAPGAILATNESRWGHVAYVESIHGSTITVSEMNYSQWGRVNYRTLPASYGVYIY